MLSTTLLPLKEAAAYLPKREGKKPHLLTVKRWITQGLKDGHRRVYLLAEKVGGAWFTCEQWIDDFKRDLTRSAMRPMPRANSEERRGNNQRKAKLELQRRYGFDGPQSTGSTVGEQAQEKVPALQPAS